MEGVDLTVTSLVGFARALRHSGMACGPGRVQAFLAATEHVGLADRATVYWAGRLTLCSDPDDLPRFDAAFEYWFGDAGMPESASGPPLPRQVRSAALDAPDADSGEAEESEPIAVAASAVEVLRERDMSELSVDEREHLRRMLSVLRPDPPPRPALRYRPSRRGTLDPRATLRELLRTGGEPLRLPERRRASRARRVVLLIDVSGSMSPYADALLRFAHVVVRRAPASTEVFTLGTRMTRVSRQLRQRDPEYALAAASRAVPDFSGGTRLGETLRLFLDRWGQRGIARGAVVVLFSDGWERGGTDALAEQMGRLRRLARAVLWANPHAGRAGYEPVQSGIVAALPHVDRLVAGHSLRSLEELWTWVLRLSSRPQHVPSSTGMGANAEVGRA
jgi:uncharacterized protein with von Willebrand factor type A (vWA) domain